MQSQVAEQALHRAKERAHLASRMRKRVGAQDVAQELLPGASIELLKELHLLTRDGDLNADSRRKLKQINHLIGLIRPAIDDVLARHADPVIVDCGAGKSYLGFLLYQLVLEPAQRGTLWAVESRPELAAASAERAERLGFTRFHAIAAKVDGAPVPERVHVVTALHACDTATDDALLLGLRHDADHLAVVPCCQAEVARQLKETPPSDPVLATLASHALHRRELGSHLTNVVRGLVLEARGHKVTVTELVGWEHSLKNELILGKKVQRYDKNAEERLQTLISAARIEPKLVRELGAIMDQGTSSSTSTQ